MNNSHNTSKEGGKEPASSILEASKCKCNSISVPPVKFCYLCNTQPELIEISSKGSVLSFTLLHVPAAGFKSPVGIALIKLNEGAVIISNTDDGRILDIDDEVNIIKEGERFIVSN